MEWLGILVGVAVGAATAWTLVRASVGAHASSLAAERDAARAEGETLRAALSAAQAAQAGLQARLEEREKAEAARRASEAEQKKQLEDAFGRLAQDALAKNSAQVAATAEARFKPLKDQLEALQKKHEDLELKRVSAYARLDTQLAGLQQKTDLLAQASERMTTALSSSAQARGRWGEVSLRNIVEAAGMTEHCDFETQETLVDGSRPDMVVNLPDGTRIPIDAKAPLLDYQSSFDSGDDAARRAALDKHAKALKKHVVDLAARDYPSKMPSRGFVLLFVPTDGALASAYERDPELYTVATQKKVFVATPTSLMSILMSCAMLWQQKKDLDNAQAMGETARELYERVAVYAEHVERIGEHIDKARASFDKAAGSYQSRVLATGKRLERLTGPQNYKKLLPEGRASSEDAP
ncbi:MAG: DNA recombination protein RmuC [Planctomycetia bacterium]